VGGAGKEVRASDAQDREATDTVECGKVTRIRASLRCALAVVAGLHPFSMVAATAGRGMNKDIGPR
jgi:hypothetical protein